jgi:hypothetical protein
MAMKKNQWYIMEKKLWMILDTNLKLTKDGKISAL